jgi:hypothetical protein
MRSRAGRHVPVLAVTAMLCEDVREVDLPPFTVRRDQRLVSEQILLPGTRAIEILEVCNSLGNFGCFCYLMPASPRPYHML